MVNLIFQHVLIMHVYILGKLVSLSSRKPFRVYLVDIMKHAGLHYPIVSGRAVSILRRKRQCFHLFKKNTKLASNFNSDQLVTNAIAQLHEKY